MKKLLSLSLVFLLTMSLSLFAQDTIKMKTLGRSPLTQPITNAAMAKQVVKDHAEEIGKLENDGLFFDLAEQINEAEFRNEILPIGIKMRWMMFRDRNGIVRNIKDVEWAGQEPIPSFGFEILHNNMIYRFSVLMACGNICLLEIKKEPEKPITPPPPPQPIKPTEPEKPKQLIEEPKITEPQKPEQPKTIIPPSPLALPQIAPTKKHRPNIKIHAGPWIPWEPMKFSVKNQNIDIHHDFTEYLPENKGFIIDENTTTGTIYLNEKSFPYQPGDKVILNQKRSLTTHWSGINFNIGLEIRAWKQLWLGIEYYRSRTLHIGLSEYTEDMIFNEVKYLGYYSSEERVSCPPKYHRYCLDLNRITNERETNYSIFSQEIHFVLRYYLNIGRFSLTPSLGVADQQFVKKTNDKTISTTLYPWKDKIILESGREEHKTEKNDYQTTWIAGLSAELKLHKFVSIAAEGSYRKFPAEQLIHESVIVPELNSNFQSKPWRATATLKILF